MAGRIGIVLAGVRSSIRRYTVRETVSQFYAGLYFAPRRVPETIDLVGLEGHGDDRVGRLSGGQQRASTWPSA